MLGQPAYEDVEANLRSHPRAWVVTGGAGFIGSHLVSRLLRLGQSVTVVDNFSTGFRHNIDDAVASAGTEARRRIEVLELDVGDGDGLAAAFQGSDVVFHQAALGSVPRSIKHPAATHRANVDGTFHVLEASRQAGVRRVVFASSGSIYGDDPENPRREDRAGRPLSPYAASKAAGERLLEAWALSMGLETVSLRYFNVFGPRQNPEGGYAAVIPRWIQAALDGGESMIFGDGKTTRDFCFIENVIQANLLAATAPADGVTGQAFNIGCEDQTDLNELHRLIRASASEVTGREVAAPTYTDFRPGDVRHSRAVIERARKALGYEPVVRIEEGLRRTVAWYAGRTALGAPVA